MSIIRAILIIAIILFSLSVISRCTKYVLSLDDTVEEYNIANEEQCIEKCKQLIVHDNNIKVNPIYIFTVDLGYYYTNSTDIVSKTIHKTCRCVIP